MPTPEIHHITNGNALFLASIFDELWERALIAGFPGDPGDPTQANWTAYRASCLPGREREQKLNMYFCPSLSFSTKRQLSDFVSFHVIVIDDYGTKVVPGRPEQLLRRQANYILETSPGNYQAGWFVKPTGDLAWVRGMLRALKSALGAGDNLTDPMAWRRLPVGINGKATHRTKKGEPWVVDLASEVMP